MTDTTLASVADGTSTPPSRGRLPASGLVFLLGAVQTLGAPGMALAHVAAPGPGAPAGICEERVEPVAAAAARPEAAPARAEGSTVHPEASAIHPEGSATRRAASSARSARPTSGLGPSAVAPDDALRALYRSGRTYDDFLGRAARRVELWQGNTERAGTMDPALVERARAVGGTWYVLAVAVDSCSDSVSTIPYLAGLVSLVDGLDLRIVDPEAGRAIMESHPTPDGRAATPTVLLLDAGFDEAGCFIERPPTLQTWIVENDELPSGEVYERKMAWYAEDAGHETVQVLVEMLEAAARGDRVCR